MKMIRMQKCIAKSSDGFIQTWAFAQRSSNVKKNDEIVFNDRHLGAEK